MAFVSLIEYASGEFAGFEFAREQGALLVATDFSSAGEGQAQFAGGAIAHSRFDITSQSTNVFVTQAYSNAVFELLGEAGTLFEGSAVVGTDIGAHASTVLDFHSGIKLGTTVAMEGTSEVTFFSIDGFGFDITAGSTVAFFSSAYINSALSLGTNSSVEFVTQTLANSRLVSAGSSVVQLRNDSIFEFTLSAPGQSASTFNVQAIKNSFLVAAGSTSFIPKMHAVIGMNFTANGAGIFVPSGYVVANSKVDSVGSATLVLQTQRVVPVGFDMDGVASMVFNPGNPVFASLPSAYDVVIRPYENRTAIRPKEIRETEWR